MQEADGDRLHALIPEIIENRRQAAQIQRPHHLATVTHALRTLPPEITGHEGFRLPVVKVEEIRAIAAGNLQRIAEALGGDQANPDSLSFREGVDDHRRAMGKKVDRTKINVTLFKNLHHAALVIGRRGGYLGGGDA